MAGKETEGHGVVYFCDSERPENFFRLRRKKFSGERDWPAAG